MNKMNIIKKLMSIFSKKPTKSAPLLIIKKDADDANVKEIKWNKISKRRSVMRNIKSKLCGLILLALGITGLQAQQVIPATGGDYIGSGGSVSFSVGQVAYFTIKGINGSVAPGVQQPFEISVVSGIEEAKDITLRCSAYPNPTTDFLILKIEGASETQYIASLYDINGKLLENKKIGDNETRIDMRKLVAAIYFLKVTQTKPTSSIREIKTFKIIKN